MINHLLHIFNQSDGQFVMLVKDTINNSLPCLFIGLDGCVDFDERLNMFRIFISLALLPDNYTFECIKILGHTLFLNWLKVFKLSHFN